MNKTKHATHLIQLSHTLQKYVVMKYDEGKERQITHSDKLSITCIMKFSLTVNIIKCRKLPI